MDAFAPWTGPGDTGGTADDAPVDAFGFPVALAAPSYPAHAPVGDPFVAPTQAQRLPEPTRPTTGFPPFHDPFASPPIAPASTELCTPAPATAPTLSHDDPFAALHQTSTKMTPAKIVSAWDSFGMTAAAPRARSSSQDPFADLHISSSHASALLKFASASKKTASAEPDSSSAAAAPKMEVTTTSNPTMPTMKATPTFSSPAPSQSVAELPRAALRKTEAQSRSQKARADALDQANNGFEAVSSQLAAAESELSDRGKSNEGRQHSLQLEIETLRAKLASVESSHVEATKDAERKRFEVDQLHESIRTERIEIDHLRETIRLAAAERSRLLATSVKDAVAATDEIARLEKLVSDLKLASSVTRSETATAQTVKLLQSDASQAKEALSHEKSKHEQCQEALRAEISSLKSALIQQRNAAVTELKKLSAELGEAYRSKQVALAGAISDMSDFHAKHRSLEAAAAATSIALEAARAEIILLESAKDGSTSAEADGRLRLMEVQSALDEARVANLALEKAHEAAMTAERSSHSEALAASQAQHDASLASLREALEANKGLELALRKADRKLVAAQVDVSCAEERCDAARSSAAAELYAERSRHAAVSADLEREIGRLRTDLAGAEQGRAKGEAQTRASDVPAPADAAPAAVLEKVVRGAAASDDSIHEDEEEREEEERGSDLGNPCDPSLSMEEQYRQIEALVNHQLSDEADLPAHSGASLPRSVIVEENSKLREDLKVARNEASAFKQALEHALKVMATEGTLYDPSAGPNGNERATTDHPRDQSPPKAAAAGKKTLRVVAVTAAKAVAAAKASRAVAAAAAKATLPSASNGSSRYMWPGGGGGGGGLSSSNPREAGAGASPVVVSSAGAGARPLSASPLTSLSPSALAAAALVAAPEAPSDGEQVRRAGRDSSGGSVGQSGSRPGGGSLEWAEDDNGASVSV